MRSEQYQNKEYDKIYIINELNKYKEFKNICKIIFNKILKNEQINEKLISKKIRNMWLATIASRIEFYSKGAPRFDGRSYKQFIDNDI